MEQLVQAISMEGGYFRYIFQPSHGLSEEKFKLALVGLDILGKDDNFETRTDLQICPLSPFLSSLGHPRRHIPKYYMYRGYLEELIRLVCPGLELIFMHFHQSFWSGCTGWYFLSRETKSLYHLLNIFTRNIHAASRTRTCDLEAAMDSKPTLYRRDHYDFSENLGAASTDQVEKISPRH